MIWEPVEKGKYDDFMTAPAYGYVYSVTLLRGSRVQQLEAHIQAFLKVRSFLSQRVERADYYLRCEDFVDTTGDMRQNFGKEYNQLRTKYKFSEHVQYVPRIKRKEDRIAALQSPITEWSWLCFSNNLVRTLHGSDEARSLTGISTTDPTPRKALGRIPWSLLPHNASEQRRMWREQAKEEGPPHVFYSYT